MIVRADAAEQAVQAHIRRGIIAMAIIDVTEVINVAVPTAAVHHAHADAVAEVVTLPIRQDITAVMVATDFTEATSVTAVMIAEASVLTGAAAEVVYPAVVVAQAAQVALVAGFLVPPHNLPWQSIALAHRDPCRVPKVRINR